MKPLRLMFLIFILLGLIPVNSVWARGGHHHGHHHHGWGSFGLGLGLGYGLGYGGYGYRGYGGYYGWGYPRHRFGYYGGYYPPYYAYPPVVAVPSTPPVYIQQQRTNQSVTESQADYWYYCRKPEGYYPHVKKCPDGWMQVVPQSSPAQ